MMRKMRAFTLIEMVVVIVILGILAAVAAPRFIDVQNDARASVIEGVAGAIKSAAVIGRSKGILAGFEHRPWANNDTADDEGRQYHFGFPATYTKGLPQFLDLDGSNDLSKGTEFIWAAYTFYSPGYTVPVTMVFTFAEDVEAITHPPYPTTAEIESTQCYARYEIHADAAAENAQVKVVTETSGC